MYGLPGEDGLLRWARVWADCRKRQRRREWWDRHGRGLLLIALLFSIMLLAGYLDERIGW